MKKLIIFLFLFVSPVAGLAQDVLVPPAAIDLGIFGADVSVLTLDTIGSAVEDTELGLYDAAGNLLDENDDIGGGVPHTLQSEVVVGNLTGGTYYAAVSAYDTTFGPADFAVSGGGVSGGVVLNYSDGLDLAGAGAASLDGADTAGGVAWFSFEIGGGGGGESHTLEIAALSNGTVSGGGTYRAGATATLEALPNPGYVFTGWSGDASGNDNPFTLVMNGDRTVGATFAPGRNSGRNHRGCECDADLLDYRGPGHHPGLQPDRVRGACHSRHRRGIAGDLDRGQRFLGM